ncbi:unnamed protein product, partial [Rotaria sordida]
VRIHFDNSKLLSNNYDNSGIRFYIGNELRKYDLGYLTFAVHESSAGIAIPPVVNQFEIDAYCPVDFSQKFPESGITVISAFPHSHFQGKSVWTKIILNKRAVEYLFNAESFNFNYQF